MEYLEYPEDPEDLQLMNRHYSLRDPEDPSLIGFLGYPEHLLLQ